MLLPIDLPWGDSSVNLTVTYPGDGTLILETQKIITIGDLPWVTAPDADSGVTVGLPPPTLPPPTQLPLPTDIQSLTQSIVSKSTFVKTKITNIAMYENVKLTFNTPRVTNSEKGLPMGEHVQINDETFSYSQNKSPATIVQNNTPVKWSNIQNRNSVNIGEAVIKHLAAFPGTDAGGTYKIQQLYTNKDQNSQNVAVPNSGFEAQVTLTVAADYKSFKVSQVKVGKSVSVSDPTTNGISYSTGPGKVEGDLTQEAEFEVRDNKVYYKTLNGAPYNAPVFQGK